MRTVVMFTGLLILPCTGARAQVIHVPVDEQTIQQAINAAVDGDTVLVAEGTYYENINFRGKAIVVASLFLIDGNETHIGSTVIDGSQPANPDSASVVTFNTGEDTTSVLLGFTVTGGTGNYNPSRGTYGGGGILMTGAGGRIQYNRIVSNIVIHPRVFGGGVTIDSPVHDVLFLNNVVADNQISATTFGGGAGIFCYELTEDPSRQILIAENVVTDNVITGGSSSGGGVNLNSTTPLIRNNLIARNRAEKGGGVQYHNYQWDVEPRFVNNTVVSNSADIGGGFHSDETTPDDRSPRVLNSIVWGNTAPSLPQVGVDFVVEYSNVEGGHDGAGNIDLDPQFADTVDYYLTEPSPCVDAGHPSPTYQDAEDPDNAGLPLSPALGELRNDMGAYGGSSVMFAVSTARQEEATVPRFLRLRQNYPNPFNPTTTISYDLPRMSEVRLSVYDLLGREVRELASGGQPPGHYEVSFDAGDLPSGVYFYRLVTGDYVETRRMVVVK